MLKILTTQQIKDLDAYTIQHEPVASIDLMERACHAFVDWFTQKIHTTKKVGIICGTGNNGGDGLGIARLLDEWGYSVKVWIVRGLVPESEDFKCNLKRIQHKLDIVEIISESDKGLFIDCDILIDAIFGSGLSRPPEGIYAQAIACVNQTDATRIAVDIPSGLMADTPSSGAIVCAHYTISFQLPKLAFFFPQSFQFTGKWVLVDITLDKNFIKQAETQHHYITLKSVSRLVKPRSTFDHKGTFGHALLVAGSLGKIGASVLASRAALRAGLGLCSVHTPKCGYTILQTAVPEAMVSVDNHENYSTDVPLLDKYATVGIGPGIGLETQTIKAFSTVLEKFKKPMVIDADGLTILSRHRELLHLITPGSILTPHPKEFERLAGAWKNDFERLEKQKRLALELKSIIILKGAFTSIATPEGNVFFNSTGNPGMATGGTGDVLTGILTGLLSQSYTSQEAALLGVFLHGLSGDLAAREIGMEGLVASDLVKFLPNAFKKLTSE
jgi:hydroxyethylthiazole kinase-like uncharacterized protein yjeF